MPPAFRKSAKVCSFFLSDSSSPGCSHCEYLQAVSTVKRSGAAIQSSKETAALASVRLMKPRQGSTPAHGPGPQPDRDVPHGGCEMAGDCPDLKWK